MKSFYDDPAIIADLLSARQNPAPKTGQNFMGAWLFARWAAWRASKATWMLAGEFRCQCGSVGFYRITALEQDHTTSCGCLRNENTTKRNQASAIHPPHLKKIFKAVYFAWKNMKRRCYDPEHPHLAHVLAMYSFVMNGWKTSKRFSFGRTRTTAISPKYRAEGQQRTVFAWQLQVGQWKRARTQSENESNCHRVGRNKMRCRMDGRRTGYRELCRGL